MRENEWRIFEQFRQLRPDFAGRPVECGPGANPPDVLCVDGGVRIGLELAEWLNEWQIAFRKARERKEESYRSAICTDARAPLTNIGYIWVHAKKPLNTAARTAFEGALFDFLAAKDAEWPNLEDADHPQGIHFDTFPGYPVLGEYLARLDCFPVSRGCPSVGTQWIHFPAPGGVYRPEDAVDSLVEVLRKKSAKYATLRADENLDELYLLLFYDQGWFYNSPYRGLHWGFNDVAHELRRAATVEHGHFDKIFLFDAVQENAIEQVWP